MGGLELRYLSDDTAGRITHMVDETTSGEKEYTADSFLDEITQMLPIEKMKIETVRRRIEGLYLASELLFRHAMDITQANRNEIVRMAKLKPLSHYHYLTGSREPHSNVLSRGDYLNDPTTAMVKLREDIYGLVAVFPRLRKIAAKN